MFQCFRPQYTAKWRFGWQWGALAILSPRMWHSTVIYPSPAAIPTFCLDIYSLNYLQLGWCYTAGAYCQGTTITVRHRFDMGRDNNHDLEPQTRQEYGTPAAHRCRAGTLPVPLSRRHPTSSVRGWVSGSCHLTGGRNVHKGTRQSTGGQHQTPLTVHAWAARAGILPYFHIFPWNPSSIVKDRKEVGEKTLRRLHLLLSSTVLRSNLQLCSN